MTTVVLQPWESKRTDETRWVEERFREHFEAADSYRQNSASIRVRVVDPRFEGLSRGERDAMVEPIIDTFPRETQIDIVSLFTFAPGELAQTPSTFREYLLNVEFLDPGSSEL